MTLTLVLIVVGFALFSVASFVWLSASILCEVETQRTDLARDASPCTQRLTRYQR